MVTATRRHAQNNSHCYVCQYFCVCLLCLNWSREAKCLVVGLFFSFWRTLLFIPPQLSPLLLVLGFCIRRNKQRLNTNPRANCICHRSEHSHRALHALCFGKVWVWVTLRNRSRVYYLHVGDSSPEWHKGYMACPEERGWGCQGCSWSSCFSRPCHRVYDRHVCELAALPWEPSLWIFWLFRD